MLSARIHAMTAFANCRWTIFSLIADVQHYNYNKFTEMYGPQKVSHPPLIR